MKFEANMEAVILRQSEQLQTKVVTKPGLPGSGWWTLAKEIGREEGRE